MTHSANGATTELNASAWDKNAIAFIRERGLESEFSDWCGGWPVPREARLDDARERQRHSSPPSSEGEGNRETNEKDRSISQSGYDAPDGAASAGSEGSGAWRPIETAPKDGTRILAWTVHQNARYAKDPIGERWACPTIIEWIDHNGGGWTWHGLAGEHTHWMPLPGAPGEAASPESGPITLKTNQSLTPLEEELVEALRKIEAVEYPAARDVPHVAEVMALVARCRIIARSALSRAEPRPDSKALPVGRGER